MRFDYRNISIWYRRFSFVVFNTLVLFVVINLVALIAERKKLEKPQSSLLRDPAAVAQTRGIPLPSSQVGQRARDLSSLQPDAEKKSQQIVADFKKFGKQGIAFSAYTHTSAPTFKSKSLNISVDPEGFSSRDFPKKRKKSKWPHRVFVFGGSSTLGWNVDDVSTLPFYLEGELTQRYRNKKIWKKIEVTNYASPYHSWYQEMVLFQKLLHSGKRPQAVVFVDGINALLADTPNEIPFGTQALTELWDNAQLSANFLPAGLPLFRWINQLADRKYSDLYRSFTKNRHPMRSTYSLPDWTKATRDSYLHTLRQVKALSEIYKIKPYFVWQPNRAYLCQSGKYPNPLSAQYQSKIVNLYSAMKDVKEEGYTFLGNLCRKIGFEKNVFVDQLHYSPEFNRFVAKHIAAWIVNSEKPSYRALP